MSTTAPDYNEDHLLAAELYVAATGKRWSEAPSHERRPYLIEACMTNDKLRRQATEQAEARVKGDAVDAYRAQITTTIPAHRIETRINGFKDGWEAAMLALRGEDTK